MKIIDFFEIYKFIIIGIIAVSIDAFVYFLLGNFEFFSYEISKRISDTINFQILRIQKK